MLKELYLIGFAQSIFFTLLILTKKKRELKDLFLMFFILIMGLNLLFLYSTQTDFYKENPLLILFDFAYWTLIGPSLYLYIYLTVSEGKGLKYRHLLHLMPLLIVYISFADYIINIEYYKTNEFKYNRLNNIGYFVWMYNSPIYYILSIVKIKKHKSTIKDYYSYTKSVDLKWLYFLTSGFAIFLIFLLGGGLLKKLFNIEFSFNIGQYTWLIMIIYIFGIGFFGYKQKGIFSDFDDLVTDKTNNNNVINEEQSDILLENVNVVRVEGKNQYLKSGLKQTESKEILAKLVDYMSENKPYLNWDLNLKILAESLNTTTHKLSQAINENLGQTFYEFINQYRVDEVKRLLASPESSAYNIVAIAYDAGFNTKSSFYSVFKKYTNKTPTEYRKQCLQSA